MEGINKEGPMNLGHETEQIEFKKSTSEIKEGVVSITAILNKHQSGVLYFGVKSNGDVCGQAVSESTLRQISQAIGNCIEPRINPIIEVLDDGRGIEYIRVSFEGKDTPYACKGTYRTRVADEDVIMTVSQIKEQIARQIRIESPWDRQASKRAIADVDEITLRAYVERGNERGRIPFAFSTVEDVLDRLDLLVGKNLTNAADVLFCPSKDIALKMGLLASRDRTEILDLQQEKGTIFDLVHKAEFYVLSNTRRRFEINEVGARNEIPEFPKTAVKEALMNAFIHRDWTLEGSVQIDIFPDSVEILSPGWFIEGQNPDEHLAGISASSRTRNRLIAEALFRSGDIESYGTGIPRIKKLCSEVGVQVGYERVSDGTKLIFYRNDAFVENALGGYSASGYVGIRRDTSGYVEQAVSFPDYITCWKELSDNERTICSILAKNGSAKTPEIAPVLGITQRSVLRTLEGLINKGIVVSQGSARSRSYRLKESADQSTH